jgi:hypothetical protein
LIANTPIAGAPVQVNTDTKTTDVNGQFSASLENSTYYTIASGLEAISFTPLYETGGQYAARSPVTIEATRLISPAEDPCRLVIDGAPHIYFSSNNVTDKTLTVPLTYTELNAIYSVTGQAVPAESFAPGTSGFSVPESYFSSGTSLKGVWKFLGQDITVSSGLQVCTDRGVPGSCEVIDPAQLRSPFEYTRRVILKLTNLSIAAARAGKWRGANGKFSVPFLVRGAKALATMEKAFRDSKSQNFVCDIVPKSCSLKKIPKAELRKAFAQIFSGKVPRGLEHISSLSKREIALFQREMRRLPEKYVTCE